MLFEIPLWIWKFENFRWNLPSFLPLKNLKTFCFPPPHLLHTPLGPPSIYHWINILPTLDPFCLCLLPRQEHLLGSALETSFYVCNFPSGCILHSALLLFIYGPQMVLQAHCTMAGFASSPALSENWGELFVPPYSNFLFGLGHDLYSLDRPVANNMKNLFLGCRKTQSLSLFLHKPGTFTHTCFCDVCIVQILILLPFSVTFYSTGTSVSLSCTFSALPTWAPSAARLPSPNLLLGPPSSSLPLESRT